MTFTTYRLNRREHHFIIVGIIALIIIVAFFSLVIDKKLITPPAYVIIGGARITVEAATTPSEQYQGLSGRPRLCQFCGMLFIFKNRGVQTFVMRDMLIPLDMVFIDDDKIVKIASDLLPEGAIPQNFYSSDVPVDYVLELNAGFTDQYDINVGDTVQLSF